MVPKTIKMFITSSVATLKVHKRENLLKTKGYGYKKKTMKVNL